MSEAKSSAVSDQADLEMLQEFAREVSAIRDLLLPIVNTMRTNYSDPKAFENFGQVIDRIYGTAATMGYTQFAAYCLVLKSINYQSSQGKNLYAMGQVKELNLVAVALLEKFIPIIMNPAEVRKIQYTMQKETDRANELSRKFFGSITRKTAS